MKHLLTIALLALTFSSRAQNFEGSITWSVNYSLTNHTVQDKAEQYLPKQYTFKKKEKNYLISANGGQRPIEMLWLGDKRQAYRLDLERKTYSSIIPPPSRHKDPADAKATIVRTKETRKILGYTCTRYIIRQADPNTPVQQVYWITNALDGLSMKKDLANLYMGSTISIFHKEIDGMPLRIEIITSTITTIAEATSVKKGPLSSSLFTIPSDFMEAK